MISQTSKNIGLHFTIMMTHTFFDRYYAHQNRDGQKEKPGTKT
jgi:hypothetical protein